MSLLFAPSGQRTGASTSASVLPVISFRIDWFDVLAVTDFIFLGSNTTKGKQKRWLTFLNHDISHTEIQFPASFKNKKAEGGNKLGPQLFAWQTLS